MISFAVEKFAEGKLSDLKNITNLSEDIDYDCVFIVARDESYNILGVAGVNLYKHNYPRFEHIIIHPSRHKTKLVVELMWRMEEYLSKIGRENYVSYIFNENKLMQKYAEKWGMKSYSENGKGKWYYKDLQKIQECKYAYA